MGAPEIVKRIAYKMLHRGDRPLLLFGIGELCWKVTLYNYILTSLIWESRMKKSEELCINCFIEVQIPKNLQYISLWVGLPFYTEKNVEHLYSQK